MTYHIDFDIDFLRNTTKGKYFAIEGIDGSGKSTQVLLLKERLEKIGKKVLVTSEPKVDSEIGKMIHNALQAKTHIPPTALQYLYSADRVINQETLIKPALEEGKIILSHRAFWSAVPYGLMDKLMGLEHGEYNYAFHNQILIAQGLLSMYHRFIIPDRTFFLKVSVETTMNRLTLMNKTKEVYEKQDKLEKINEGYMLLLQEFPQEFVTLDGERSEEEITEEIYKQII